MVSRMARMTSAKEVEKAMEGLAILIADSNVYTRKLTRMMLVNLGAKLIYEVGDGVSALDAIRNVNPDVMIINWGLPIIMLTDVGKRSRVTAAVRLGVHEFLVKPVSPKTLQQRLLGILLKPRP